MQRRPIDFLIPAVYLLADAIAIESAFLISYFLRFDTHFFAFLPLNEYMPPLEAYLLSSLAVIPVWMIIFESAGMYAARRNASLTDELFSIGRSVTLGMLIVMSVAFFYRAFSYSRVVFVLLWGVSIFMIFVLRVIARQIEKSFYRNGKELRNAVIIGSNALAVRLCSALRSQQMPGYKLAGYFDDGSGGEVLDIPRLGSIEDAPDHLAGEDISLGLITLDHQQHDKLLCLVRESEGINVEFMMVPDVLDLISSRMEVREIDGIPLMKIKGMPMTAWGRIIKRTFDLVITSALLVILAPLYLIIAIVVKLDSPGPVLYTQERMGEDGQTFRIFKFRSMRVDAEQNGPVWSAGKAETRHTRSGKWLRLTSLDELPQLFNVLRGEMSLVGPRPERPYFVDQFKGVIPKYLDRHRVKAGMTGWAQVNGLRGDSSLEERIKYDIYYIENWSLGFDIKILVRTVGEIFSEVLRHMQKA